MTCHLIMDPFRHLRPLPYTHAAMLASGAHSLHVGFVRLSVVYVSLLCVDLT